VQTFLIKCEIVLLFVWQQIDLFVACGAFSKYITEYCNVLQGPVGKRGGDLIYGDVFCDLVFPI